MITDKEKAITVVGLGSMGMGAALSCVRAGHRVFGVDLSEPARNRLQQAGAAATAADAREFAAQTGTLLLLLVNAAQVRSVLFDSGLADQLQPGTLVMVSSTIAAADARDIASRLQQKELLMLDAPVSGGAVKAEAGEMTVMASGSEAAFDAAQPVLNATASCVYRIGSEIGQGSTVKIIHQLLAGVHIAAAAEAMALAAKAEIPLDLMYEVVTHAAGNSWMFENRMKHVLDGDYSPRSMVDIFVKDLGLVSDTAKDLHFPLPLAHSALNQFTAASNAGYGRADDSAVIKVFQGISLPGGEG